MNGENNFGNDNGFNGFDGFKGFNSFNNNPNELNNNQSMQASQNFSNPNTFSQEIQPNQEFSTPNMFSQGIQQNQPINEVVNYTYPNGGNIQINNGGNNKKKKFLVIGGIVVGIIAIVVFVVSLVRFIDNNENTLTCKSTINADGVKIESIDVYVFEEGYNTRINHTYLLSRKGGYTKENVQAMKDDIEGEEITAFGWDPKVTKSGKKIKVTSYTPRMGTDDYETVKQIVEDAGYKCK